MVTLSKEEALALLHQTRASLIMEGRRIAWEQIIARGSTHSRAVLAEMRAQGILDGLDISDHWLGVVFHCALFRWTGEYYAVEAAGIDEIRGGKQRNIHPGRAVKVWTVGG